MKEHDKEKYVVQYVLTDILHLTAYGSDESVSIYQYGEIVNFLQQTNKQTNNVIHCKLCKQTSINNSL